MDGAAAMTVAWAVCHNRIGMRGTEAERIVKAVVEEFRVPRTSMNGEESCNCMIN